MNTTSAFPAEGPAGAAGTASAMAPARRVLIWDAPVRVFHWLMVLSFAGAYLSAESERWRLLHVTLGYTMAGLVAFRIVWGLVGTRHARFSSFVRGPAAALRHLRAMVRGEPDEQPGHNPAGALAIVALLLLTLGVAGSGYALYNQLGGEWLEGLHEAVANTMLGVVLLHVTGVAVASWKMHVNLVRAMVTGHKPARPEDGIRSAWRSVAALMLVAVLGFWWLQWQSAPSAADLAQAPAAHARSHEHREHKPD